MNEIELELLRDGYPLIDQSDEGDCCEDNDDKEFRCKWRIETVELPDPGFGNDLDDGLGGDEAGAGLFDDMAGGGMDALSSFQSGNTEDGMAAVTGMLAGDGAGGGGILGMAMGFIYPTLKGMLEASIRKVVVTIEWNEGSRERSFDVVQIVTNPMLPNPELAAEQNEFEEGAEPGGGGIQPLPSLPGGGLLR